MDVEKDTVRLWAGQSLHFACLVVLLGLVGVIWQLLNRPFTALFWSAVLIPVAHQVFVWLAWRLELQRATISRAIGFSGYLAIFLVFFIGRFLSLLWLAWVDRGSLGLSNFAATLLALICGGAGFYAMYSVQRFFGIARAAGADHFDVRYRNMPLVEQGIFRYTKNGMYCYAFLLFWAVAFCFNSAAALTLAAFSHAYIWVHYYATEKPDMTFLYGNNN